MGIGQNFQITVAVCIDEAWAKNFLMAVDGSINLASPCGLVVVRDNLADFIVTDKPANKKSSSK